MAKHPGGRPTKYQGEKTIQAVNAIIDILHKEPTRFLSCCGMEQVAVALEVCVDTLYEWQKVHPEFSEVVKKWVTARNATLYQLAKTLPPAIWIFMTKNMLGWSDKQDIKQSGEVKHDGKLVIEIIDPQNPAHK